MTKKKVRIELITRYNGTDDRIGLAEADIEKDNTFFGTCNQLFYHDGFQRDKDKPSDAKFTLEVKASGTGAEKESTSKPVELPMAASTVILKKGKYDDTWVKDHAATHPKSGKEYVPDNKVKKLQENLFRFRLLKQDKITGLFDDATEAALKDFQELAKKPERKKGTEIKTFTTEKITYDGSETGTVGEKTEKEVALWQQNNWVKPEDEIMQGSVDDTGVRGGKGTRDDPKYFEGIKVTDLQKLLKEVKAYDGDASGFVCDKTHVAIKLFQEHAIKGTFIGPAKEKIELPEAERLKVQKEGVACGETVEMAKKAKEKGWKVAGKESKVHTDWKQGFGRSISGQNKYNDEIEAAAAKYNVDPLLLKSIIAQESNFDPTANNQQGCAGLTQIAKNTVADTGLSIGKTKKEDGRWIYDFDGDERFDPKKSIEAGAKILSQKRNRVTNKILPLYSEKPSAEDFLKLWVASYNAGEGTVLEAVKNSSSKNPQWDDLLNNKEPKKSSLYKAIPQSWGADKKYIEITEYVENVIKRKMQ
ncbi:MAG: transglycosylase SLT domain-containing protein [Chitinispirillaceae bacterium]|nr:transglycosylase SLT domain-containing protein [Chitinispirillaceae bacterium]